MRTIARRSGRETLELGVFGRMSLRAPAVIGIMLCACASNPPASSGTPGSGGTTGTGGNTSSGGSPSPCGSTGTPGGPAAVTDLLLTNQGANTETIAWTAAVPGSNPIDHYKICRNGVAYDMAPATATTYTDQSATNATVPGDSAQNPHSAATVYSYNVSAVDTQGNEGPLASQMTAWWYHDGTFYANGEFSNPVGGGTSQDTTNWCSTAVASQGGACVAYVTSTNWWQPYSGGRISPLYAMDIGAFNYLVMDIYSTASQSFVVAAFSRGPAGDLFNNLTINISATAGQWQHYKIALTPTADPTQNLGFGFGQGTGWFAGTTLTATSWISGVKFEPCTWVTGPGVTPDTMINQANCAGCAGEAGSSTGLVQVGGYDVTQSQNVGSAAAPINLTLQRTNAYKLHVEAKGNAPYYVDNLGFTTN
ncbi:MAG: hypothetical protein WBP56_20155 [Polyangia bacterium]